MILSDHDRAVGLARVVNKEPSIGGILRVERQSQEASLTARQHSGDNVKEYGRGVGSRLEHLDSAGLLEYEQPIASVVGVCNINRTR